MRSLPKKVVFIKVTNEWYQLIKANYITTGSDMVNMWKAGKLDPEMEKIIEGLEPGELALFTMKYKDGVTYIIGGGFFLSRDWFSVKDAWKLFGVRNGVMNYEDFVQRVTDQGGDLECLKSAAFKGVFIFSKKESLIVPDELSSSFNDFDLLEMSNDDPAGLYLTKLALERRYPQLQSGRSEHDWPGIYLMAAKRIAARMSANFEARVLQAYDFTCCISGCNSFQVLDVAHIKTFFDDSYQDTDNGIVMRCDFHRLFAKGFITAYYKNDDTIVLQVSKSLGIKDAREYLAYDGRELMLPDDRSLWPNRKSLEWHRRVRYENWLRFGDIQPVPIKKMKEA